jgi:dienelactone hydrolase
MPNLEDLTMRVAKHCGIRNLVLGGAVAALTACATIEPVHIARIELHQFASTTLTDTEHLTGKKEGKPVTLAGELRIPTLGKDKLPAVVLLQGGVGIMGFMDDWARELNAMGIATFIPDSVTGRNVDNITKVGRLAMLDDAYRSLDLLAKHPRIDANRIAVMGFSAGGHVALYSSMKRFQRSYATEGGPEFAAYVALYPICHFGYRERDEVSSKPIHGSADDLAPMAPCQTYVAALNKAGKDARLYEYAGAGHVFDWVMQKEPRKVPDAVRTGKCRLEEGDAGALMNSDTGKPFTPKDACVEKGATYAYHAAAHRAVEKDVREFLAVALRLPASNR